MRILKNSVFQRIILFIAIIIILLLWKNSAYESELQRIMHEQNTKAILDSAETYIDSLDGLITSERLAFLGGIDSLEKYNKRLASKIKNLESKSNTIILSGSETEIEIKGFAGESTNTKLVMNDTIYKFVWSFKDSGENWEKILSGYTNFNVSIYENDLNIIAGNTVIDIDKLNFIVDTYFVQNEDKSFSALAKSSYPGMILRTSGVLYPEKIVEKIPIIPAKNTISWGIQTGIGINPLQINNGTPIMLYVGVGLQYKLGNILTW